jgi:hypothetical protein
MKGDSWLHGRCSQEEKDAAPFVLGKHGDATMLEEDDD